MGWLDTEYTIVKSHNSMTHVPHTVTTFQRRSSASSSPVLESPSTSYSLSHEAADGGGGNSMSESTEKTIERRVRKRTSTKRDRIGCLTCRQRYVPPLLRPISDIYMAFGIGCSYSHCYRRKKCDAIYPVCGHCKRLNRICEREAPWSLESNVSEQSKAVILSVVPRSVESWSFTKPNSGNEGRYFLGYYMRILAQKLTTNHENNSFLSGR